MFRRIKSLVADSNPYEYYKIGATGVMQGEALKLVSNELVRVGVTETPEFIAQATGDAGVIIPVERIKETTEYETVPAVTVAETLVGSKVTLDANGRTITTTTVDGVFMLSSTDAVEGASTVRGYFRR